MCNPLNIVSPHHVYVKIFRDVSGFIALYAKRREIRVRDREGDVLELRVRDPEGGRLELIYKNEDQKVNYYSGKRDCFGQ